MHASRVNLGINHSTYGLTVFFTQEYFNVTFELVSGFERTVRGGTKIKIRTFR